mmetsp:Transcript_17046/g.51777  ORF Transcript_17046/g.51777 Transcript_17046/m.51777 type:complete len:207 (+) Transcript_17046:582-1202(+)
MAARRRGVTVTRENSPKTAAAIGRRKRGSCRGAAESTTSPVSADAFSASRRRSSFDFEEEESDRRKTRKKAGAAGPKRKGRFRKTWVQRECSPKCRNRVVDALNRRWFRGVTTNRPKYSESTTTSTPAAAQTPRLINPNFFRGEGFFSSSSSSSSSVRVRRRSKESGLAKAARVGRQKQPRAARAPKTKGWPEKAARAQAVRAKAS